MRADRARCRPRPRPDHGTAGSACTAGCPSGTAASSTRKSGASSGSTRRGGGVGGRFAFASSANASSRRGCSRAFQPNCAATEPNPPTEPCNGPDRMATYWLPDHAEGDRRAEHGGCRVEGPEPPAVACRIGMDVAVGLSLEHEVACRRERAAVVRPRRRDCCQAGRARTGSHATSELLRGVRRRIAVAARDARELDGVRDRLPVRRVDALRR